MKLLSYLYQEALDNCSNEHYPVLLALLKTSCEPYTRWGGKGRPDSGWGAVGGTAALDLWAGVRGRWRCCVRAPLVRCLLSAGLVGEGRDREAQTAGTGRPLYPVLLCPLCPPGPSLPCRPSALAGSSTTGCTAESSETFMASS